MRDPRILDFIRRVRVELEPAFDAAGGKHRVACRAAVVCRNKAQHSGEVLYRKGSHEDPMSAAELAEKFADLAGKAVARETTQQIAATVEKLERSGNSGELTQLLSGPARA